MAQRRKCATSATEEFRSGEIRKLGKPANGQFSVRRNDVSGGRAYRRGRHAREALALARRLGDGGNQAHALCLTGDVASTCGTADPEGYYCQALAVAELCGMRPRVAHCHFGLGKLHCRASRRAQAQEHLTIATAMYCEMGMIYWLKGVGSGGR